MSELPRGIRLNNPGNVRKGTAVWQGAAPVQQDTDFITFIAPEWGIRCIAKILLHDLGIGCNTIEKIIARWAPTNENDTESYIDDVCSRSNLPQDELIVTFDFPEIIKAIIWHENGQQPYSDETISAGISLADGD